MTDTQTRRRHLSVARLRKLPPWSVLATGTVVGGLIGGAYGMLTPPTYTATSYVIAVPAPKSDSNSALGFAQAYGRVATQPAVLAAAQEQVDVPVETLQRSVQAATSPDAPMVALSATSSRPYLASEMANAVSRALTRQANAAKDSTHVQLVQFSRAVKPTEPTSASSAVTALVGASAGGLLSGLTLLAWPGRTGRTGRTGDDEETAPAAPAAAVPGPAAAADARRGKRGKR
jgi:capsular polysaccharide biosynthesis protein